MIDWKWLVVIAFVLLVIRVRVKRRGYFWKAKDGEKLTFKQFLKRWWQGVEGVTPLQQTKTTLWGFPFIVGGSVWGFVVTLIDGTYWMALLIFGTFPITAMQIVSNWQKYKSLKKVEEAMKNLK